MCNNERNVRVSGILVEGFGCILAGMWGTGSGTTSYSENVGAIGITKVSRSPFTVYKSLCCVSEQWRIHTLWKKGSKDKCISLVIIYRKCTQRTLCLLYGKGGLMKKVWANRGRPPHLDHSNSPLFHSIQVLDHVDSFEWNWYDSPVWLPGWQMDKQTFSQICDWSLSIYRVSRKNKPLTELSLNVIKTVTRLKSNLSVNEALEYYINVLCVS